MNKFIVICLFLLLSDVCGHAQIITTIAGNGIQGFAGDGGLATSANLYAPPSIAVDDSGNLFISVSGGATPTLSKSKVRKVNTSGIINTFAGIDTVGFSGDGGPASAAKLYNPDCIAFDRKGNVFIADLAGNRRIRKVDKTGIITTFAGNGSVTYSGDGGPATAAGLGPGQGVCVDTVGNVYIGAGNRIRKVDTAGIITTIAGTGLTAYNGDGISALSSNFSSDGQIAIDKFGNIYVADVGNHRIRKINAAGIITTVAGNGIQGYGGDGGMATGAQLFSPTGVYPDDCGNIYIADFWNNRVRAVSTTGIITTIAGTGFGAGGIGTGDYTGDGGAATAARLNNPETVFLDKHGNIYIADKANHCVRYIHMDSCRNTTEATSVAASEDELRVFPNPNNGTCSITLSTAINEPAEIVITNILGMVVQQSATTTNKEIEVKLDMPAGMYFVSMRTKERWYNAKMVVE